MKSFVLLFVVVIAVGAPRTRETQEKIDNAHKHCIKETGVDKAILKKATQGEFADDLKLKQQYLCFSKYFHFQNDAGELQADTIKTAIRKLPEEQINKILSKCVKQQSSPGETAIYLWKCWLEVAP